MYSGILLATSCKYRSSVSEQVKIPEKRFEVKARYRITTAVDLANTKTKKPSFVESPWSRFLNVVVYMCWLSQNLY
jgi:hypothetical protein